MGKRICTVLALVALGLAQAGPASAGKVSTTVLGLLSEEGEAGFAEEFSQKLREAVGAREKLGHTGKDQTLEQVAMAFGCLDSLDPMCLKDIGDGLETTNLLYGSVEVKGEKPTFSYEATVTLFDVPGGKIVKKTAVSIASDKQGSIYLQEAADRVIAELFNESPRTTVIVQSNVAGAAISLDGEDVGETGSEPLWLREVEPGEHTLVVEKEGYETFEKTFEIETGKRMDIDAPLLREGEKPAPGSGVSPVKGGEIKPDKNKALLWSGVAVGALGLGLIGVGAGMTAMVSQANDDLAEARETTLSGQDVCSCFTGDLPTTECFGSPYWPSGVSRSKVKSACSNGKTGQTTQFIFYGVGGAAAVTGLGLLVYSSLLPAPKQTSVSLAPLLLPGAAGLAAGGTY